LGLISLLDLKLSDLPDAKLWHIDPTADHRTLTAAARGKIDLGRIQRQWPDILRVIASTTPALSPPTTSCASSHPAARALVLGGRVVGFAPQPGRKSVGGMAI
jgi:TnpA family transposase